MECNRCGATKDDVPHGLTVKDYFERMYGEYYCGRCLDAYEDGIWMIEWDDRYYEQEPEIIQGEGH